MFLMQLLTICRARPRFKPQPEIDLEGNETGGVALVDPDPSRCVRWRSRSWTTAMVR